MITSTASSAAVALSPYQYDASSRATATGTGTLVWSKILGPSDFSIDPSTGNIAWLPVSPGDYTVGIAVTDDVGSTDQIWQIHVSVSTVTPPEVVGVFVASTAWSASTVNLMDPSHKLGYPIPVGSGAQLLPLPWGNINEIKIMFSENVTVAQTDLALTGINTALFTTNAFSYDSTTFTATWTLAQAIGADKLLIDLNADGSSPIVDATGNRLDGEWTNPTSTTQASSSVFPSGNGIMGGNFLFRFNVLPGDVDQSGVVQAYDGLMVDGALGAAAGSGIYTIFKDVNGDGQITADDATLVRNTLGNVLPAGSPSPGSFPSYGPFRGANAGGGNGSAASSASGNTNQGSSAPSGAAPAAAQGGSGSASPWPSILGPRISPPLTSQPSKPLLTPLVGGQGLLCRPALVDAALAGTSGWGKRGLFGK